MSFHSRVEPDHYSDRFEWSRRDVVSYVRDLVELFGGTEAFAKGLLCRRQSVEQVIRGDAPPEFVIHQLGIQFDNKSGKYYRMTPPEIYQLPDGVMPLRPAEWLELTTLRIENARLRDQIAKSADVDARAESERRRRELLVAKQDIDRLSRENARLKREAPEAQSAIEAIKEAEAIQHGDDVVLCQEEIARHSTYMAFSAKYGMSRLSVLNMAKGRISAPRSKWRPVIEAALARRAVEARDAA